MTTTPTPEQFLTQRDLDEDDLPEPDAPSVGQLTAPDPIGAAYALGQVVDSIGTIAAAFSVAAGFAEERASLAAERECLREQLTDLESKHGVLLELVAEIEDTVKPSTSKLANAVRDALSNWSSGDGPIEPAAGEHVEAEASVAGETPPMFMPPADDADVEEWRDYVKRLHGTSTDPTVIDAMNRSQIRSLLGISHPGAEA